MIRTARGVPIADIPFQFSWPSRHDRAFWVSPFTFMPLRPIPSHQKFALKLRRQMLDL